MHARPFVFQSQPTVYTEPLGHVQLPPASLQMPPTLVCLTSLYVGAGVGAGVGAAVTLMMLVASCLLGLFDHVFVYQAVVQSTDRSVTQAQFPSPAAA